METTEGFESIENDEKQGEFDVFNPKFAKMIDQWQTNHEQGLDEEKLQAILQPQFQQIYMALSTNEETIKEMVEKMK